MPQDVTRYITREVERELWARAAGRCQFGGCNNILFRSPLTQEPVNIAQKAHIYSFSEKGPRGWGPFRNKAEINDISNLLLACHACHKTIDQNAERYPGELLLKWKKEHEHRIAVVTGVNPDKRSHVILYGANIGAQNSPLQPEAAKDALFPEWYPAEERTTDLSMNWEGHDHEDDFWRIESKNLNDAFDRRIKPLVDEGSHLSVFGLAPMPLLTLFGSLLTDKANVQVYQLHREPKITWQWLEDPSDFSFLLHRPVSSEGKPALVLSLSDSIAHDRITDVLGPDLAIWELTIDRPHNDFLKSKGQLSQFRQTLRQLFVEIGKAHGKATPITIFPAMPVACAVELGRVRMPKADNPWIIYDQNNRQKKFLCALEI